MPLHFCLPQFAPRAEFPGLRLPLAGSCSCSLYVATRRTHTTRVALPCSKGSSFQSGSLRLRSQQGTVSFWSNCLHRVRPRALATKPKCGRLRSHGYASDSRCADAPDDGTSPTARSVGLFSRNGFTGSGRTFLFCAIARPCGAAEVPSESCFRRPGHGTRPLTLLSEGARARLWS